MTGQDRIEQPRLEKLSRLISRGIDPYPHKFQRTHANAEAVALYPELTSANTTADMPVMRLDGRVTAIRFMGKAAFFDIRDGSGKVQVFFRRDSLGEDKYDVLHDFDLGDFLGAEGRLFMTRSSEITLEASDFAMLAKSLLPLPEKWHGLKDVETRFRRRELDLIANQNAGKIVMILY